MLLRLLFVMMLVGCVLSAGSVNRYVKELNKLDDVQKKALIDFSVYGKTSGYGYILPAIAYVESKLCKAKKQPQDGSKGSYGCMQIQVFYDAKHRGMRTDSVTLNRLANKHVKNDWYNAASAVKMLNYWKERHNGDMRKMLASYNAGNAGINSSAGRRYAKMVMDVAKAMAIVSCSSGLNRYIEDAIDTQIKVKASKVVINYPTALSLLP